MQEFVVAGISYRTGKMDLFTQSNVIRRLAPVLSSFKDIAAAAQIAQATQAGGAGMSLDAALAAVAPLLDAVSRMKDDDVNFIMSSCLAVVSRKQGEAWARVWNAAAKAPMFDDIDLMAVWTICANVLMDNLSGFFSALPTA